MKGWIELNVLSYKENLNYLKELNIPEPDDNFIFLKSLIQISNIHSIDLEQSEEYAKMKGGCCIFLGSVQIEVRETAEEIIKLIENDPKLG